MHSYLLVIDNQATVSPRKLFIADNAVSNTGRVKQTNLKSVDKDMQVSPEKENYNS